MSNIVLYLRNLQASFRVPRKLITSSLLLGLLSTLSTTAMLLPSRSTNAKIPLTLSVAQSQKPAQRGDVQAMQTRLSGQWQAKNSFLEGQTLTLIFTADGKLFLLFPDMTAPQQLGYRIDATPQPMHLDVIFPGNEGVVKTIFEFTADGQLRLQLAGTDPEQPRPTAFDSEATLFQKVSDATTLPPNVQVSDPQTGANRARQAEGKNYIGAMNRAQQAYYLEYEKFASKIEELGIGIKPETENYRYQILPQGNQTQSVMMTAQAKRPELRSYAGAVFVVKSKDEILTLGGICETDEASSTPPAMPAAPSNESTEIQCPAGSHRLGR